MIFISSMLEMRSSSQVYRYDGGGGGGGGGGGTITGLSVSLVAVTVGLGSRESFGTESFEMFALFCFFLFSTGNAPITASSSCLKA
jgi:hypothetical protein